jgi:transaldolase
MKLLIDAANTDEIAKAKEYGFLSGVTTNRTLVAREGASFHNLMREIAAIPMTGDGLKAVRALSAQGVRTNTTLVFSPAQALLASHAGANFVSVFIGRADDVGFDEVAIIRQIADLFDRSHDSTIRLEKFMKDWSEQA